MAATEEDIEEWFSVFAENEDNLLSLDFVRISSDEGVLVFSCGDDEITALMPPRHSSYHVSYKGAISYVNQFCTSCSLYRDTFYLCLYSIRF